MVAQTKPRTGSAVIEGLVHSQANAIAGYLNYKRYHWFTYGAHFRDLHLFFDELAEAAFAEVDPFGERIRMLGGDPVSHPKEIERAATIRIADGKATPRQMLEDALDNELHVIEEMKAGARAAEVAGDYGTNDLYATSVQTHEKYAWFIREFVRKDDGMGV